MAAYPHVLSCREVLGLLKAGTYKVLPDEGAVLGRRGQRLVLWPDRRAGRLFVRLYYRGRRKSIAVAKLVWMSVTGTVVPRGFEVHHEDGDATNDRWGNLLCLHAMDHRKKHGDNGTSGEEVPF